VIRSEGAIAGDQRHLAGTINVFCPPHPIFGAVLDREHGTLFEEGMKKWRWNGNEVRRS
jgi:hypothetical protein